MAGALFGTVAVSLFVAGALFGTVAASLFVAGAVFGENLVDSPSGKRCNSQNKTCLQIAKSNLGARGG